MVGCCGSVDAPPFLVLTLRGRIWLFLTCLGGRVDKNLVALVLDFVKSRGYNALLLLLLSVLSCLKMGHFLLWRPD